MAPTWQDLRIRDEFSYEGPPYSNPNGTYEQPVWHSSWYVVSGEAVVTRGARRWRAGPGCGLILPARWRRHQLFIPDTRIVSLALSLTWPDTSTAVAFDLPLLVGEEDARRLLALARRLIAQKPSPADPTLAAIAECRRRSTLHAYAEMWLDVVCAQAGATIHQPGSADPRLSRLADTLAAHARLGPMPWEELHTVSGLARTQMDRLCWKTWGISVCGLRDRIVLERARGLLADSRLNLAGIAREIGATDASHLVKWYRRCTGTTPGKERQPRMEGA